MDSKEIIERYTYNSDYFVYYRKLIVGNYKCFKHEQVIEFLDKNDEPAKWTVILGENGTGKTTILQLIDSMRQSRPIELGSIDKSKFAYIPRFFGGGHISFVGLDDVLVNSFLETQGAELEQGIRYDFRWEGHSGNTVQCNIAKTVPNLFAYGASRRIGKGALTDLGDIGNSTKSLYESDFELINAEEWFLQASFAVEKSKDKGVKAFHRMRFTRIKDTLLSLLPDVDDIRIKEITIEQDRAAIEVHTPYGWVSMTELSHGYKTLIAWTVDLAARMYDRYPDSENPLAEAAIVLVDEIDLHLHPKWQRTLMQDLSRHFPNAQFIVTAHSPLIVQAADENTNVVLLKREGDYVVIENDVDVIKGWRVDQILASDLYSNISTRPPEYDALLDERDKILGKKKLLKKDKERLKEISVEIESWPSTYEMDDTTKSLIEETKELLKQHGKDK